VIDPEAGFLYNELGNTYAVLGRHAEALATHQRYAQLAPDEPFVYDRLGLTYQWAGRYEEALASYQQGLSLDPEFEILIAHLGNLHFWQGRHREALAQYRRYIKVAPSNNERSLGYGYLAWLHRGRGEMDQAAAAAVMETSLQATSVGSAFLIALDRGDLQGAKRLQEQLLVKDPYHSRGASLNKRFLFYFRGYLALKSGRGAEAIEHFKGALRQEPVHWFIDPLEDCLANAYLELGQPDEAIAEYERILRLNPNYPLAHYRLGQAYERKGEREKARFHYEQFIRIWNMADPDIPEVIAAKKYLTARS
jgi:tetratricopeptide (TPR) repeat protein